MLGGEKTPGVRSSKNEPKIEKKKPQVTPRYLFELMPEAANSNAARKGHARTPSHQDCFWNWGLLCKK